MAIKTKKNLLSASEKVLQLAAARRKRMSARAEATESTEEKAKAAKTSASAKKGPTSKKVAAARTRDIANGGFHDVMTPVGDLNEATGGDPDDPLGIYIPKELEKALEEGMVDEDTGYQAGLVLPPALEGLIAKVADPASLTAEAVRFDLVPFGPAPGATVAEILSAGAHWMLCANGEPLARIALKDQENGERIASHFVSPDYARSVIDGIQKHGLEKTMSAVKAKPYVAVVDTQKKVVEAQAKLAASAEASLREKTAKVQDSFVKNLGLVLEASANNFLVRNELKDVLIASMSNVGIPEEAAASMVDDAFFSTGPKTIAGFLDKAREWTNHTPEAMKEITETVKAAGRTRRPSPSSASFAHTNPNYDHSLAARMASAAVPVTPAADAQSTVSASVRVGSPESAPADDKAAFRARYGGFRNY